jgi:hypothetical protein
MIRPTHKSIPQIALTLVLRVANHSGLDVSIVFKYEYNRISRRTEIINDIKIIINFLLSIFGQKKD